MSFAVCWHLIHSYISRLKPVTTFKLGVFVGRCVGMSGKAIEVMLSTLNVLFAIGAWYIGGIARGTRPAHNTPAPSRPVTGGGGTLSLGAAKASEEGGRCEETDGGEGGRCEETDGGEGGRTRTGVKGFMTIEGLGDAFSLCLTPSSQLHFI